MTQDWPYDALPRDTLLHGYRIVQVLGRGGFGITYKAVDRIDQSFAIKEYFPRQFSVRQGSDVVPADAAAHAMFADCLDRFTNEARALTLFSNQAGGAEGVVRVITYFEAHGTAYIVMEFLEGQCFDRIIAAHPQGLPQSDLLRVLRTLLPALARVHANHLLHRDIKPANIFLRANGAPVLLDFGAARVNQPGQTDTYSRIFTENYAPIEQMQGLPQGPYSDIYALGVTCYQAIAGGAYAPAGTMSITRQAAMLGRQTDPLPPAATLGAGRYDQAVLAAIDWSLRVMPEDRPQDVASLATAFGLKLPNIAQDDGATRVMTTAAAGPAYDGATQMMPRGGTMTGAGFVQDATVVNAATVALPRDAALPVASGKKRGVLPVLPWLVAVMVLAAGAGFIAWRQPWKPAAVPAAPSPSQPVSHVASPDMSAARAGDAALAAGDSATALQRYREAAGAGDTHAQYQLGYMFQNGIGVMADFAAALGWYGQAAHANYAPAQSQIGFMYLTGQAGSRDYGQALSWFRLAAAQNYPNAEYQLGFMAQHGLGMKRDFAQMQDYYNQAARQGYAQAQQQLGYCYQIGLGVEKNPGEAVRWYSLAAEQKLPTAMFSLGQMYFAGLGIPADPSTGRDWITRAANAGNADARRWLATH
jgi:TPR repeat protein